MIEFLVSQAKLRIHQPHTILIIIVQTFTNLTFTNSYLHCMGDISHHTLIIVVHLEYF